MCRSEKVEFVVCFHLLFFFSWEVVFPSMYVHVFGLQYCTVCVGQDPAISRGVSLFVV